MSTARQRPATTALLHHLQKRSTARLRVRSGAAQLDVFVHKGRLMGATSPTDEARWLRWATASERLSPAEAATLKERLVTGQSIFGDLLDARFGAAFELALDERFEANLTEFVGCSDAPELTELPAIFLDNLHFDRAPPEPTVLRCAERWDLSEALDLAAPLLAGAGATPDALASRILARLQPEATVGSILAELPGEPRLMRARLAVLVAAGVLRTTPTPEPEPEPDEPLAPDDATEHDTMRIVRPATPSAAPSTSDIPRLLPPVARELVASDVDLNADDDDAPPSAADLSAPTASPEGVQRFLTAAHAVAEEELDFFEDHDATGRGGGNSGAFQTDTAALERVEAHSEQPEEDALEADEAPASRFGAPTIDEDEAAAKIDVANQVLDAVVAAFDAAEGKGRGREAIQLLMEGSGRYAILLGDVQATETGRLPHGDLLDALFARPEGEQRLLIVQALADLLERALSAAADELVDEQALDALFESTAGYRSRLGL